MAEAALSHSHDYPPLTKKARAQAISQAAAIAKEKGLSFTPQRKTVYELLLDAGRPLGAYSLLEEMAKMKGRGIAPPTIYRALDFLVELGVVSRLESSNEFVPCNRPEDPHDCIFLICTCCKKASEIDDARVHRALNAVASSNGFQTQRQVIEVQGLCKDCS